MICLFEPQCKGWQHEEVNAGMIEIMFSAFPNEKVLFVSDKNHWNCVREILDERNVRGNISFKEFMVPEIITQDKHAAEFYYDFISTLLEDKQLDIQNMVLLSSHRGNMLSVKWLADRYKQIKFTVVVHAIMEQLFMRNTLKKWKEALVLKNKIKALAKNENTKFIIYSPVFCRENAKLFSKKVHQKFIFIHHPYVYEKIVKTQKKTNEIRIGIIGASVNAVAIEIINRIETIVGKGNYSFVIMRSSYDFRNNHSVKVIQNGKSLSRKEMRKELEALDYVLLPYNRKKYKISASGAFCDALNGEIPMLMLDSPLLKYYNKQKIGWQFSNVDDMVDFIVGILRDESTQMLEENEEIKRNIKRLKEIQQEYNKKEIINIL